MREPRTIAGQHLPQQRLILTIGLLALEPNVESYYALGFNLP